MEIKIKLVGRSLRVFLPFSIKAHSHLGKPINRGRNMHIEGIYTTMNKTPNSAKMNGQKALAVFLRLRRLMVMDTNTHAPEGGVMRAIFKLMHSISPKWSQSSGFFGLLAFPTHL